MSLLINSVDEELFKEILNGFTEYIEKGQQISVVASRIAKMVEKDEAVEAGVTPEKVRQCFIELANTLEDFEGFQKARDGEVKTSELLLVKLQKVSGITEDRAHAIAKRVTDAIKSLRTGVLRDEAFELIDLDWKFQVEVANSQLEAPGTVYIQLFLKLRNCLNEVQCKTLELNVPEFYRVLHELEKTRLAADRYK